MCQIPWHRWADLAFSSMMTDIDLTTPHRWVQLCNASAKFVNNNRSGIPHTCFWHSSHHINGLVQDCSNSSALAMELLQSWTKPSICPYMSASASRYRDVYNYCSQIDLYQNLHYKYLISIKFTDAYVWDQTAHFKHFNSLVPVWYGNDCQ